MNWGEMSQHHVLMYSIRGGDKEVVLRVKEVFEVIDGLRSGSAGGWPCRCCRKGSHRGDELLRLLLERRCHCVSLNLIRDLVRELDVVWLPQNLSSATDFPPAPNRSSGSSSVPEIAFLCPDI